MMNFTFDRSGDIGVLTLDGDLTTEGAVRLKTALMISLENADQVLVNFRNVSKIDRRCLELLCSAHRISVRSSKVIRLNQTGPVGLPANEPSLEQITAVCRSQPALCCQERCLWAQEGPFAFQSPD